VTLAEFVPEGKDALVIIAEQKAKRLGIKKLFAHFKVLSFKTRYYS